MQLAVVPIANERAIDEVDRVWITVGIVLSGDANMTMLIVEPALPRESTARSTVANVKSAKAPRTEQPTTTR